MDESLKKKSRRQQDLLTFLEQTGYASVEELTAVFAVTSQTIRRDIADLSGLGKVRRYHGGVALSGPIDAGTYRLRRTDRAEIKRKIAERTAQLVSDGSAIFLDAGSTCEAVAEALTRRSGLKVVTYSLRAAVLLTERTDFTVAVPGGFVRHVDGSVVGDTMVDFIRRFRFDAAIVSVSGIEDDGSMGDDDQHEVAIVRAAMCQARSILLATDSSKFTRTGLVRLGSVTEVSDLVTEAPPEGPLAELIASSGIKLHIV